MNDPRDGLDDVDDFEPVMRSILEADEAVQARARAVDAMLAVSDRRVIVLSPDRVHLSVSLDRVRRIQFDIERTRPATLVIVPDDPRDTPQVLAIPASEYEAISRALVAIGLHLHESGQSA
ncbi:MAG TPA: hypothetical protein VGM28_10550 [Candidatus Limnocylindrales bacterium]|jgi:hypothetical protein